MKKYCKKCDKGTEHRKLEQTGFLTQCLIAAITRGADLRESTLECIDCGLKSD